MSKKTFAVGLIAVFLVLSAGPVVQSVPTAAAAENNYQSIDKSWFEEKFQQLRNIITDIKNWVTSNNTSNVGNISGQPQLTSIGDIIKKQSDGNNPLAENPLLNSDGTKKPSSMTDWFNNFINKLTGKNNTNSQQSAQQQAQQAAQQAAQQSAQQQQQQQSGGGGGGGENGTPKTPYKIEANQFKKVCGQNTYVLYWRKGGMQGRDMAQPAGGAGAGKDQGAKDYWQLPTCEELAECHCCCNTCKTPESECKQDGWVFNDKGCPPNCKSQCDGDCKPKCEQWQKPTGPGDPELNRDCKCNQEGCPVKNAKNCKIMIIDPGKTQVEYTKKDGKPEQYFKGTGIIMFLNGNGPADPKSKIQVDPKDKKGQGWTLKLKPKPGVCCKCYQDGPPIM